MSVEAWQLCILVTTGVVLTEIVVNALLRRRDSIVLRKHIRTGALGLLAVLTIVVVIVALGPSLADQLSSVAAAVTAVVAVWLTYRSYNTMHSNDAGSTSTPDIDTLPPTLDNTAGVPTDHHRDESITPP
jgi:predicted PurR-regulated permease PerM